MGFPQSRVIEKQGWKFYAGHEGKNDFPLPLFFYHLPKCGGMTFDYAVQNALAFSGQNKGLSGFSGRVDFGLEGKSLAEIQKLQNESADQVFLYGVTHDPFGVHATFEQNFNLVTVLRDPTERIGSAYSYGCMRKQTPPSSVAFEAFIKSPANKNTMTKMLSGDGNALVDESATRALENLKDYFKAYVTLADLDKLICWVLETYQTPNVMLTPSNATLKAYRFDAKPFDELIKEHNSQDLALYESVASTPRLPELSGSPNLHSQTIINKESQSEEASTSQATVVPTQNVLTLLGL